tara:strand:- start:54 stop:806 length:753 start_codon:yes stop_codon:yes gene_type:complete
MKKPYSHFDLPTQHLGGEHYIPPRARDEEEIERRRSLPAGSILIEQQARGLRMARTMMSYEADTPDIAFMSDLLAQGSINTSWYTFARPRLVRGEPVAPADVMRRRLYLTPMADDETDWRETREGLRERVADRLTDAIELADTLVVMRHAGFERQQTVTNFGRLLGGVSIDLACYGQRGLPAGDAHQVMAQVRQNALTNLERARTASDRIGVAPSVAQLPDADSETSVYWRRNATKGAYEAYERALEEAA